MHKVNFMVIKIDEKVRRTLVELNPFWSGPFQTNYKPREIYSKIEKFLDEPQIISLCGLRRVGKTTILEKIITELLQKNPADRIMYFSFDEFHETELWNIIDTFKEIHVKEPKFLFLDEIQKLSNWAEKVKTLYDTKKYKIFISGSESLFLKKGATESLAGRIYEFEVKKLNFAEHLQFREKNELASKPLLHETELRSEFNKYVTTAGFPELIGKEDHTIIKEYIKKLIEKIIYVDIPTIYPIENPEKLKTILEIITENPGMLVDLTSFSQELGISRQSLSKYFEYLENAHLLVKIYNYSKNRSTSEKKLKKFYPTITTPAITNTEETTQGKIIENLCVLDLNAKFFWRDKQKNEVDIILQNKETTPIEIKYRNQPQTNKGIEKFCKKYHCKKAIILTKNTRKKTQTTQWIPVHEYLLTQTKKQNNTTNPPLEMATATKLKRKLNEN